jgi:hypothetical protein
MHDKPAREPLPKSSLEQLPLHILVVVLVVHFLLAVVAPRQHHEVVSGSLASCLRSCFDTRLQRHHSTRACKTFSTSKLCCSRDCLVVVVDKLDFLAHFLTLMCVTSKFRLHSGTRIGIKTSIALFGSMVRLSLISRSPDRANAFWMSGAGRVSSRRNCGCVAAVTRTTTRTRTRRRAVTMARNHHHHHHSRSWVWIPLPP